MTLKNIDMDNLFCNDPKKNIDMAADFPMTLKNIDVAANFPLTLKKY